MAMTLQQKQQYALLLQERITRNARNRLQRQYKSLYGWQRQYVSATASYDSCLLMAGNQVGKSRTGCIMDAYHLLGDYPDDWEGHRFDSPPLIWVLGYSGVKTRDLLQLKLFGRVVGGECEGGLVPKDRIVDYRAMTGTSGAASEVRVKHRNGTSVCQFWSYSQGQHALMGDVVDWYHIDEEPRDQAIYPQVITRTINGDRGRGGRGILTFTPENGKTELVLHFMESPGPGDYMQMVAWDQCPHMTPEKQEKFLSKFPAYQRDMRSKGVPLMGSGLIFEVDIDTLKIAPFRPPEYWFIINGIDFGWDHPQAHIQLLWDRDADMYYVCNAWKASKKQPYEAWHIVKPWAENVPTAWPGDGLQTEKGSGKTQMSYYADEGWKMLGGPAQWEDGGTSVWIGITQLQEAMENGRLKIFSNLFELFEEIQQYHTKTTDSGKIEIVKLRDDLVDAMRYAYMMRRFAIRICDTRPLPYGYGMGARNQGRDATTGY